MIAGLKPYPQMRDSDVDWLDVVPEHWPVARGIALLEPKCAKNIGLTETQVLSLSYGRIVVKPDEKLRGLVPENFETYQHIWSGDIVVRATDLQNDKTSLRVAIARDRGIITSAYLRLTARDGHNPDYAYRLLHGYDVMKVLYGYGSGLRQNLEYADFKQMPVPIPPPDEQAAIVRFLDHADRRIRRSIAAKQKMIRLLEEQKAAIIHQAVTRGLNPDAPMKPSGVTALGEVPSHWAVCRLRHVAKERRELNPGNVALLSVFLNRGVIPYGEGGGQVHAPSLDQSNYQVVRPDDLVLNNQQAWRGSVGVSRFEGIISPAYIVLDLVGHFHTDYANLLFRSGRMVDQFVLASKGVGDIQRQVAMPALWNVMVPMPPIDEQAKIAASLAEEVNEIDRTVSLALREIELLQEYRARLVADVVTGKLDVRDAAAQLGDEERETDEPVESESIGQEDEEFDEVGAEEEFA